VTESSIVARTNENIESEEVMKYASFEEYQAAKNEILYNMEYKELVGLNEHGGAHIIKSYTTEENGTFYEIDEDGVVEFWSDKHSVSRFYDGRSENLQTQKSTRFHPEKSPVWDETGIIIGQVQLLIAANETLSELGLAQHYREIRKNAEAISRLIDVSRAFHQRL